MYYMIYMRYASNRLATKPVGLPNKHSMSLSKRSGAIGTEKCCDSRWPRRAPAAPRAGEKKIQTAPGVKNYFKVLRLER